MNEEYLDTDHNVFQLSDRSRTPLVRKEDSAV